MVAYLTGGAPLFWAFQEAVERDEQLRMAVGRAAGALRDVSGAHLRCSDMHIPNSPHVGDNTLILHVVELLSSRDFPARDALEVWGLVCERKRKKISSGPDGWWSAPPPKSIDDVWNILS